MKLEVVKILAEGTYKRFMWVKIENNTKCIKIDDELYQYLKNNGVLTSQKLRAIKEKGNKK